MWKFNDETIIFDKLSQFSATMVNSAYFVKSTPLKAFSVSTLHVCYRYIENNVAGGGGGGVF